MCLALASCCAATAMISGTAEPPVTSPRPGASVVQQIDIASFAFSPAVAVVPLGAEVRWTNLDGAEHNAVSQTGPNTLSPSGLFSISLLFTDQFASWTADRIGDIWYFCEPHGSSMQARLDVRRPGDTDGDGAVNFTDLVTLAQNYGQPIADFTRGDFDLSGTVDFADLVALAQNYSPDSGSVVAPSSLQPDWTAARAPVPEPAVLTAGSLVGIFVRRQRRPAK